MPALTPPARATDHLADFIVDMDGDPADFNTASAALVLFGERGTWEFGEIDPHLVAAAIQRHSYINDREDMLNA